jgi:GNAT superfamily N-acetyltransferase
MAHSLSRPTREMSVGNTIPPSVRRQDWQTVSELDYQQILTIWEEAFPPSERSAHDTVSRRDSTWLWTAHSPDGTLIGFATALLLASSRTAYLEYLAVAPSRRGSGAGTALLSRIATDLRAEQSVCGVALEVEDPDRTTGNDPLVTRRIAFYERWGARPLDLLRDYFMPDLASPGNRVAMIILWKGVEDAAQPDADGVGQILTDLYLGYYAFAAPEGHLEEMLGRIAPNTSRLSSNTDL